MRIIIFHHKAVCDSKSLTLLFQDQSGLLRNTTLGPEEFCKSNPDYDDHSQSLLSPYGEKRKGLLISVNSGVLKNDASKHHKNFIHCLVFLISLFASYFLGEIF